MIKYISSDSHFCEPPGFYKKQLPKKYSSEAPDLIEIEKNLFWTDSYSLTPMSASIGAGTPDSKLEFRCTLNDYKQFSNLKLRVNYQNKDGAIHEILLPNLGVLWKIKNKQVMKLCFDIYNKNADEISKKYLKNFTIIPVVYGDSPELIFKSLNEILNNIKTAKCGLVIDMNQIWKLLTSNNSLSDKIFKMLDDFNASIILHANGSTLSKKFFRPYTTKHTFFCINAMELTTELYLRGFFDKYSKIKLIFSETGLSWINQLYYKLSYYLKRFKTLDNLHHLKKDIGEVIKKNILVTFTTEIPDKQTLELIDTNHIMFGSDFPHNESFYPETNKFLNQVKKLYKNELENFIKNNAIKNYKLSL